MIESILTNIKKVTKAADTLSIWMFFAAAALAIIDGIIDLAYCTPSIPLIMVTAIIGLIVLARGFVRCFGKSDKED